MEKRGISQIITTILIILLVLAAIIIVWQAVKGTVETGTGGIGEKVACMEIGLEIASAYVATDKGEIIVTRKAGGKDDAVSDIKFLSGGATVSYTTGDGSLGTLETETFVFDADELDRTKKLEVAAILTSEETGEDVACYVADTMQSKEIDYCGDGTCDSDYEDSTCADCP